MNKYKRNCFTWILGGLTAVFTALPLLASPGNPDPAFGDGDGWVSTGFQQKGTGDDAHAVTRQADGKLVVAGSTALDGGSNTRFALQRYWPDGTLDTSFDADGTAVTDIGPYQDGTYDVIQQADGKLVVAGYSYTAGVYRHFALVRYNSDGSLDTTFDGDGKLTISIGVVSEAYAVVQDAAGRLVVAGSAYNGSNYDVVVARCNSDGSLDTTLDGDGVVITPLGAADDQAKDLVIQTDGKLLLAGSSHNGANLDFALVRYNSDGSLDTTFDGDGKLTTAIGIASDYAESVIQQADGKLVVAGASRYDSYDAFALVRYQLDGTLDSSFSADGKTTTDFGVGSEIAYDVTQQLDGKLVVTGVYGSFALARYNSDGQLDTSFDGDGKLTTSNSNIGWAVIQQPDDKLVVAGASQNGVTGSDIALVRYLTNGALDTSFSDDGKVAANIGYYSINTGESVVQQADGKLVVAGSGPTNYEDFTLARYHPDGTLDTSFGGDGKVITNLNAATPLKDFAKAIVQQADGKLVVAGYELNLSTSQFALVRYNTDGTLDTGFDGDGVFKTTLGASRNDAYSVVQQADGKLVMVGYARNGSLNDLALVRVHPDGTLDTSFSGDGKLTLDINAAAISDADATVIQQADGKLLVAGYSGSASTPDFALVRLNADGTLDTTFDGDGMVITDFAGNGDQGRTVIQQADGKLVVAGKSGAAVALARYDATGALDSTFGVAGKVTTVVAPPYPADVYALVQQADGKLAVAGYKRNNSSYLDDALLLRYNQDGSLDTGFGNAGQWLMSFSATHDHLQALIQQADGKLVAAGYAEGMATGQEFLLVRIDSGQLDTDNDGLVDGLDTDNDGDGVPNSTDAFPLNAAETLDTDHDGIGNNADADDDNDGLPDAMDPLPLQVKFNRDANYKGSQIQDGASIP